MKIKDLLKQGLIIFNLKSKNKEEVINEMAFGLYKKGVVTNLEKFIEDIWKREAEYSTAIVDGIAIPHAKSKYVKTPALVFARSEEGIDFEALDKKPSFLFFMIATPIEGEELHLMALANLSRKLINKSVRSELLKCNENQVFEIFKEMK